MSTNIHIYGKRDILVVKTQKLEVQTIKFKWVYQTSSDETEKIMQADDRVQAYKDCIMSQSWAIDREELIYDEDDIFHEDDPIGTRVVNDGKDHIAILNGWLDVCKEDGYTVVFEAW